MAGRRDGGGVEAAPHVVGDAGQGQQLGPLPLPELVAGPPDQQDRFPGDEGSGGEVGGPGQARGDGRRRGGPLGQGHQVVVGRRVAVGGQDLVLVHDRHPVGLEGGAGVGGQGGPEGGGVVGLADEGHRDQGVEPGVGEVGDDGDVLDAAPVHLLDLPDEQREQLGVGQHHPELVDGDALVALEDVDPDDVAPHRPDAGGDGAEGPGPVGQPHAQEHAGRSCSCFVTGL